MGKTADLTVVQKTTIDTLHKEGKTQKVIAYSNRDNRTLERIVKQNPFKNVEEIHKEWTAAGVSASKTTTHRRMQDMGFSCRIPCVKPLSNNRQRQKRLAWAKDKKDWTAAEWSKVMFSDESKFCISFGNQGPRVSRKRGEAQNPRCLRSSVKFPQSVMVWGAMSSAGVGGHGRCPKVMGMSFPWRSFERLHQLLLYSNIIYGKPVRNNIEIQWIWEQRSAIS